MAAAAEYLFGGRRRAFLPAFSMLDTDRQLPAASATAWSIDLAGDEGPMFVVLALGEQEARAALVRHLVEIGSIPNTIEAERAVAAAVAESVGVVW